MYNVKYTVHVHVVHLQITLSIPLRDCQLRNELYCGLVIFPFQTYCMCVLLFFVASFLVMGCLRECIHPINLADIGTSLNQK